MPHSNTQMVIGGLIAAFLIANSLVLLGQGVESSLSSGRMVADAGIGTGLSCGNGVVDPGEQCDGANLGGASCSKYGEAQYAYTVTPGASPSCSSSCTIDYSICHGTVDMTVLAAPTQLSASAVSVNQINVGWKDNSTNEDGFIIERSATPSFATINFTTSVGPNIHTFSNTGLLRSTTYYYRVKAFIGTNYSEYSNVANDTTFTQTYKLDVTLGNPLGAKGKVTSFPEGIDCGSNCSHEYNKDAAIALTPFVMPGTLFTGWEGDCSGKNICLIRMNDNAHVTARFTTQNFNLSISKTGSGSGRVISNSSVLCDVNTCTGSFGVGTVLTLTAEPGEDSAFSGWGGACAGVSTCIVKIDAAKSVTVNFSKLPPGSHPNPTHTTVTPPRPISPSPVSKGGFTVLLSKKGNGTGQVVSTPAGITFKPGSLVTLRALPDTDSVFYGWSGACIGIGNCDLLMDASKKVYANFTLKTMVIEPPPEIVKEVVVPEVAVVSEKKSNSFLGKVIEYLVRTFKNY